MKNTREKLIKASFFGGGGVIILEEYEKKRHYLILRRNTFLALEYISVFGEQYRVILPNSLRL